MNKRLLIILAAALFFFLAGAVAADSPFNLKVAKLYSAPDENSNLIYNIPIEASLLDISDDGNWYQVHLSYSIGPLNYNFTGWTKIPVSSFLLAEDTSAYSFTLPIRELYAAPSENSKLVYQIPVTVEILGLSSDGNWYKVKVAYNIGPFGYTYVGWANVPVGDIYLARRADSIE